MAGACEPRSEATHDRRRAIRRIMAFGLALVVAGCREEEEGRPLRYDKGKYQGAPDKPLTADQVERLRLRARRQGP